MTEIKFPVAWCDNLGIKKHRVRLPFGLPTFDGADPFALMGQLKPLLAALNPILQVIDCVTKLITFVKAIATLNPVKIADAAGGIVDCATKVLPNYIIPLQVIPFIQFAVDMLQLVVDVIQQLISDFEALARLRITEANLAASLDPFLQAQAGCNKTQNDQIAVGLAAKMVSIEGMLALINLMLTLAGQDPIELNGGVLVPDELEDVILQIQAVLDKLNAIPGVS